MVRSEIFSLKFFFFSISFHSFKFYLYVLSYHGCLPHGQKDIRQRKCWLNQKGRQLIEKPYQPSYLYIICVGSRYIVSVLGLFPPSVVKTMPHCFLLHLFFSKLVYILESALYQRCMELLNLCCVTFHNNTFFYFRLLFKKKLFKNIRGALSVVQFFFTCQNLSKIILLT